MKILLLPFLVALSMEPALAIAQDYSIAPCPHLKVEIIGVEEEAGREVGVVRITNSGQVAMYLDLAGVDPTRRFPLLDQNSYTVYTRGVSSLRWLGRLVIGTFLPPTGRLAVEPGQTVLVAADFAKAYRTHEDAGHSAYIAVFTGDPVCSAKSDQVLVAEIPKHPAAGASE